MDGWMNAYIYVLSMHGWMPERCFLVQLFLGCVIYFPFFLWLTNKLLKGPNKIPKHIGLEKVLVKDLPSQEYAAQTKKRQQITQFSFHG